MHDGRRTTDIDRSQFSSQWAQESLKDMISKILGENKDFC